MHSHNKKDREDRFPEKGEFWSFNLNEDNIGIRQAIKRDGCDAIRFFQKINLAADAGIVL